MPEGRQPDLHELVTVLRAPTVAISAPDGHLHGAQAHGVYRHDRRMLALLRFSVDDAELIALGFRAEAGRATFHGAVRPHSDREPDPRLRFTHERVITETGTRETWTVHNHTGKPWQATVAVRAATDLARIGAVKSGVPGDRINPVLSTDHAEWTDGDRSITLRSGIAADALTEDGWQWRIAVDAGSQWTLVLELAQHEVRESGGFRPDRPRSAPRLARPGPADGEPERLLRRGLDDLDALLLADPAMPDASFLAAGSPWFCTLFGRDSLWSARLLLPVSVELASGTLRALAHRQGTRYDPDSEQQPGKIPHEVRSGPLEVPQSGSRKRLHLPSLYYGTVDATALWVCLLYEAWRAGMPEVDVKALLPHLRAALAWIAGPSDPDGDGFAEYRASADTGLANQGWKDSGDGVRWADGSFAEHPLALCEVQGYAHAAALGGAALLDAFDGHGAPWREWAGELRRRFRAAFWVSDEHGQYPAIALDGDKRPVTGPSSNMAHLLGTGILDRREVSLVAEHLTGPALNSGYGMRTLSADLAGFNPLSYHCGSVWPHDTAIAVLGLAAEGQHDAATTLAHGFLRAAERFDYRLPELYGGTHHDAGDPVIAYPGSCRPQAWSAAGGVAVAGYLLGWPRLPLHYFPGCRRGSASAGRDHQECHATREHHQGRRQHNGA